MNDRVCPKATYCDAEHGVHKASRQTREGLVELIYCMECWNLLSWKVNGKEILGEAK
jgi:hypothetical protein